jgi:hypothetical protein
MHPQEMSCREICEYIGWCQERGGRVTRQNSMQEQVHLGEEEEAAVKYGALGDGAIAALEHRSLLRLLADEALDLVSWRVRGCWVLGVGCVGTSWWRACDRLDLT